MGIQVKTLLTHLRQRQQEHGVRAFHFHHVLWGSALEAAEYPEAAKLALLADKPALVEDTIPATPSMNNTEPKSPTKPKSPSKPKSPTKRKSPTKSKAKETIKESADLPTLVKSKGPDDISVNILRPELAPANIPAPEPAPENILSPQPVPDIKSIPAGSTTPDTNPSQLVIAPPEVRSVPLTDQGLYDPLLFANKGQDFTLVQDPGATGPSSWPHPPLFPTMPLIPPQFHPGAYGDPRYNIMIQQMMSQIGGLSGWPPVAAPMQLNQIPEPQLQVFHHPAPPGMPVFNTLPPQQPNYGSMDPHPIPHGEPPFGLVQYSISQDQEWNPGQIITPPMDSPKKTPRKRKREEVEVKDTPSKQPTRSSNRTKIPRVRDS